MSKQIGNVEVSVNTYSDVLQHHGILGMKWGIRRYQNADGTLTAAGRKRYDPKKESEKERKPSTNDVYDLFDKAFPGVRNQEDGEELLELICMDQTNAISKYLKERYGETLSPNDLEPIGANEGEITYINSKFNDGRLYVVEKKNEKFDWRISIDD